MLGLEAGRHAVRHVDAEARELGVHGGRAGGTTALRGHHPLVELPELGVHIHRGRAATQGQRRGRRVGQRDRECLRRLIVHAHRARQAEAGEAGQLRVRRGLGEPGHHRRVGWILREARHPGEGHRVEAVRCGELELAVQCAHHGAYSELRRHLVRGRQAALHQADLRVVPLARPEHCVGEAVVGTHPADGLRAETEGESPPRPVGEEHRRHGEHVVLAVLPRVQGVRVVQARHERGAAHRQAARAERRQRGGIAQDHRRIAGPGEKRAAAAQLRRGGARQEVPGGLRLRSARAREAKRRDESPHECLVHGSFTFRWSSPHVPAATRFPLMPRQVTCPGPPDGPSVYAALAS
jgi:hypothetical protein